MTAATDPVGNMTGAAYDNQGNQRRIYRRVLVQQGQVLQGSDMPVFDFDYDSFGQCTVVTNPPDANGYRSRNNGQWWGSVAGLRTWTVDTQGPTVIAFNYEYDLVGNVTRCTDPRSNDWIFTYNALNQVMTRQTPKRDFGSLVRTTSTYTYDANDNLVRCDIDNRDEHDVVGDPATWRTQFEYDILNRAVSCWRDKDKLVLRCTAQSYDGNDNVSLFRSGEAVNGSDPHNEVQFLYDERDLPYRTIYGPASSQPYSEQYDYTGNGWKHHDIQGLDAPTQERAITTYEYDGFQRLVHATDPFGNVGSDGYDIVGNLSFPTLRRRTRGRPRQRR